MASSILGGLTIIPGIVKSTANILGGGRTQWANFYNACFLLTFLVFGRDLINMVPTCVLASILVFVGYKLCGPKVWKHVATIGKEQFAIFAVTVFVTVTTDLLIGIGVGVAMKYGLCLWNHLADAVVRPSNPRGLAALLADPFRNPVTDRAVRGGVYDLYLGRPVVCFNLFHLIREMDRIPPDASAVRLHMTDDVSHRSTTRVARICSTTSSNSISQDGKPSFGDLWIRADAAILQRPHVHPRGGSRTADNLSRLMSSTMFHTLLSPVDGSPSARTRCPSL